MFITAMGSSLPHHFLRLLDGFELVLLLFEVPGRRVVHVLEEALDRRHTDTLRAAQVVLNVRFDFFLGRLVEFDTTQRLFTTPSRQETEDYITGRFG